MTAQHLTELDRPAAEYPQATMQLSTVGKYGKNKIKTEIHEEKCPVRNTILHLETKTKNLKENLNSKEENNTLSEQNEILHNKNKHIVLRNDLLTQELDSIKRQLKETKETDKLKDEKKTNCREQKAENNS